MRGELTSSLREWYRARILSACSFLPRAYSHRGDSGMKYRAHKLMMGPMSYQRSACIPSEGNPTTRLKTQGSAPGPLCRDLAQSDGYPGDEYRADLLHDVVGSEELASAVGWGDLCDVGSRGSTRGYRPESCQESRLSISEAKPVQEVLYSPPGTYPDFGKRRRSEHRLSLRDCRRP